GRPAPSGGRIRLEGAPIEGLSPHAVARRGISRSFQRNNLFPKLAVQENLRLAAAAGVPGPRSPLGPLDRPRGPLRPPRAPARTARARARGGRDRRPGRAAGLARRAALLRRAAAARGG